MTRVGTRLQRAWLLTALALSAPGLALGRDGAPAPAIDYGRDIRPILSENCFACHGPDEGSRKAKLRLDRKDEALRVRESGAGIVPGDPESSLIVERIESDDAQLVMPPPKTGKKLTPEQAKLVRDWIESGASWSEHWAFQPPVRPAVPAVAQPDWVRSPVDAFVRARLDQDGLTPSPEADRVTQARRLYLDLIGLPPTPEEVDAFVADPAPGAYDRLVTKLLASPHYGERWGRIWLDAARYADSDGYEKDKQRQVWFYRDWVIHALNRDLPYDQFIIEQIAGDLLPDATQDQRVATGFLRNSMINEEGGADPEQFRMEAMFDRMDALGKSVLGLTIGCAQCHTHKYDPIGQDDYYRMFAYLNNSHEANVTVYTAAEQSQRAALFRAIAAIEEDLKHRSPDWPERLAAWEQSLRETPQPGWTVVRPAVDDISTGGSKYLLQADGSILAQGYAPTKHTVKLTVKVDQPTIQGFRLELLTDPNLPRGGPGRSIFGTGALSEFRVEAAPADAPDKPEPVKFAWATADANPPTEPLPKQYDDRSDKKRVLGPVAYAIDGDPLTAWSTDTGPGRRNSPRQAVFVPETPIANPQGTILTFYLTQNHGGWNSDDNQNCNLGRFRLAITDTASAQADRLPPSVRAILATPAAERSPEQTAALFAHFRLTVPEWHAANARIEALWKTHPEGSTQLVLQDRDQRRPTNLLMRGDFLKPGQAVDPGVPAFLNTLPADSDPSSRLTFARWLVDRQAPTTARSIVNRVWQTYFGTGLVSTSEDLGSQGETPSHPELLDWLAVEFMDRGWSLKELHRLIVTSSTYRQSSAVSPALLARDPENRLLARGPRFRVDAELVRDIALTASGLLNPEVGGPSVYPPAPAFLFTPPASYGPKVWDEAKGPQRYRRALYTFRYRSVPYPVLQNFDAPNGDAACVRRTRSNTPLQALTTLNEPLFLESARALAQRTLASGTTDADRLNDAFRRCVARPPTEAERSALTRLLDRQRQRFAGDDAAAWALAADDPARLPALPEGAKPADLAAWTAVARVLLNLDETITKD